MAFVNSVIRSGRLEGEEQVKDNAFMAESTLGCWDIHRSADATEPVEPSDVCSYVAPIGSPVVILLHRLACALTICAGGGSLSLF